MSKETPETKLCKYCKSEIPYDAKVCPIAVKSKHQMAALSPLSLLLYCLF